MKLNEGANVNLARMTLVLVSCMTAWSVVSMIWMPPAWMSAAVLVAAAYVAAVQLPYNRRLRRTVLVLLSLLAVLGLILMFYRGAVLEFLSHQGVRAGVGVLTSCLLILAAYAVALDGRRISSKLGSICLGVFALIRLLALGYDSAVMLNLASALDTSVLMLAPAIGALQFAFRPSQPQ